MQIVGFIYFINSNKKKKATEIENILSTLPVFQITTEIKNDFGFVLYNDENIIIYISQSLIEAGFKKYLGRRISNFKLNFLDDKPKEFSLNNNIYEATLFKGRQLIYFRSIKELHDLNDFILSKEQAIIFYTVYISSKISSEVERLKINLSIKEFFVDLAKKITGIFTEILNNNEQKNIVIGDWIKIKRLLEQKNEKSILDELKKVLQNVYDDVSISIGISHGNISQERMLELANQAAGLSKNRGGNQIVVQSPNRQVKYYGNSSLIIGNNSLEEIRFYYNHLINSITSLKEIFITSHENADLDALGSTYGLMKFFENFNHKIYIVLPNLDKTASETYEWIPAEDQQKFITQEQAEKLWTKASGLFILDTSIKDKSQAGNLAALVSDTHLYVIDHHRVNKTTTDENENEYKVLNNNRDLNNYIDPKTSSTSQIIVELMVFHKQSKKQIFTPQVATQLLAGIYLDTNQMQKNVSSRTFEAISLLLNSDADKESVENLFKLDLEESMLLLDYSKNIKRYNKRTLLLFLPEKIKFKSEDISIMCNQLLTYKNINSAFVIGQIEKNVYKLSARSNKNVNVQLIAENLGGGGHYNIAAAYWQVSEISYNQIQKDLRTQLKKYKI